MQLAFVYALGVLAAAPAFAQVVRPDVKPVATAPNPKGAATVGASAAAKAGFLALSLADRKALQDGLGWLGFYNGVIDGGFGARTIDALVAYQRSVSAGADGVVTAKALTAIKQSAAKAKAAVGFELQDNPLTGARIGAPMKLLGKKDGVTLTSASHNETVWKKNAVQPEAGYSGALEKLYKTETADAPNRKVTYKALKPAAFFVVAGQEGETKFYSRFAAAPAGWPKPNEVRGFTFSYPSNRAKALDPVALAIANSFEPFPSAPPTPTASPTPEGPKLTATALIVAPGAAITAIDPRRCNAPTVLGKPVVFLAREGGLTGIAGDFGAGATNPAIGDGGDDLVALSLTSAGGATTVLQVEPIQSAPGGGGAMVVAALGAAAAGAPLFDRQGRLVAFVAPFAAAPQRAGVVLAEPHATIPAAGLLGAAAAAQSRGALSVAEIAKLRRGAIVGVFCAA